MSDFPVAIFHSPLEGSPAEREGVVVSGVFLLCIAASFRSSSSAFFL